jgi:hypothetical protein
MLLRIMSVFQNAAQQRDHGVAKNGREWAVLLNF